MIDQIITDAFRQLDQSPWLKSYQATIVSYSDGLSTIKPDDSDLPTMPNVSQLSVVTVFKPNDRCLFSFDSIGRPIILGRIVSSSVGAQSVPLGEALLAAINQLVSTYNLHTHAESGATTGVPLMLQTTIPAGVLSKSTMVLP